MQSVVARIALLIAVFLFPSQTPRLDHELAGLGPVRVSVHLQLDDQARRSLPAIDDDVRAIVELRLRSAGIRVDGGVTLNDVSGGDKQKLLADIQNPIPALDVQFLAGRIPDTRSFFFLAQADLWEWTYVSRVEKPDHLFPLRSRTWFAIQRFGVSPNVRELKAEIEGTMVAFATDFANEYLKANPE